MNHQNRAKHSVLLLGPLPIEGDHLGGTKVSFNQMVLDLEELDTIRFTVVDISRPFGRTGRLGRQVKNSVGLIKTVIQVLRHGYFHQVWALNISPNGSFVMGPILYLLSRVMKRRLIVRMFGGCLDTDLEGSSSVNKWIFSKTTCKCELLLLQTQALMNKFDHLDNVRWFPTTRNFINGNRRPKNCHKLLFLSQIREEKGALVAIKAAGELPPDCEMNFYGSPVQANLVDLLGDSNKVNYRGELAPDEVQRTLNDHDLLVFPTHWPGEGMPGVIIEAFQCGLPVIATRWRQIPEIVKHGKNGLLIDTNSSLQLSNAIKRLVSDHNLYRQLSEGALATGKRFASLKWNTQFAEWCSELLQLNKTTKLN